MYLVMIPRNRNKGLVFFEGAQKCEGVEVEAIGVLLFVGVGTEWLESSLSVFLYGDIMFRNSVFILNEYE